MLLVRLGMGMGELGPGELATQVSDGVGVELPFPALRGSLRLPTSLGGGFLATSDSLRMLALDAGRTLGAVVVLSVTIDGAVLLEY